MKLYLCYAS